MVKCLGCGEEVPEEDIVYTDGVSSFYEDSPRKYCPECVSFCAKCEVCYPTKDMTFIEQHNYNHQSGNLPFCKNCTVHCEECDTAMAIDHAYETESGYLCADHTYTCDNCGEHLGEYAYDHHRCIPDDHSSYPRVGTVIYSELFGEVTVEEDTELMQCQTCRNWLPAKEFIDWSWAPPDYLKNCTVCYGM